MMATPYLVGALDIGSTKTCAVIGELVIDGDRPPEVKILGVGQVKPNGIRRDAVSNIEETTEEIRQAMKQAELMAGIQPRGLYVGISAEYVQTNASNGIVAVASEEIGEKDVDRVHEVARAIVVPPDREVLHVIPQDYSVDHRGGIQHPVGMLGTRLEAEVFMVRRTIPGATYGDYPLERGRLIRLQGLAKDQQMLRLEYIEEIVDPSLIEISECGACGRSWDKKAGVTCGFPATLRSWGVFPKRVASR